MKEIISFILLTALLFVVAAQPAFTQTRARRVGQTAPTTSPSPPTSVETPKLERTTSSNPHLSTNQSPSNKERQDVVGEDDVVRVNTTLVMVPVSITDRDGRYVPDLQEEDFHIYENGIEQEVVYFASVEKPFTVVLMLDTSASTWATLGQIRDAATAFIEQLRPDDQVMVVSFARGVRVQCEPTNDRQKIREAIQQTGKGLSTHLYDAMERLMQKHLNRIQGRKAVVLFTDGVDATSNHATYESTVRTAEELDALIYPIRYDTYDPANDTGSWPVPPSSPRLPSILGKLPLPLPVPIIGGSSGGGAGSSLADYTRGERYLHDLAEFTGGRVYEANKDLRCLQDAFSHIAEELRRQYSLGYYPKQPAQEGERRHIKVRVNRSDVAVRARDSYIHKGHTGVARTPSTTAGPDKESSSPPVLKKRPFAGAL